MDTADVRPSEATLLAWTFPCRLPEPSRRSAAASRHLSRGRRAEAAMRMRALLDEFVESGDVSHLVAAQLLAALEAAMIRSASASAS